MTVPEATEQMGISHATAYRYEADLRKGVTAGPRPRTDPWRTRALNAEALLDAISDLPVRPGGVILLADLNALLNDDEPRSRP